MRSITTATTNGLAQQDYTANTFGMLTLCENITLKCTTVTKGHSIGPGCGIYSYAAGQLKLMFYTDSTMASNDTDTGITNPYFFGLISSVLNTGGVSGAYSWQMLQNTGPNSTLLCSSSMYDIVYSSVNGTISRFDTRLSNNSVANIAQLTSSFGLDDVQVTPSYASLIQAENLAILSQSNTSWPTQMALAYSKVAMSYFAGTVIARPALENQLRTTSIVSRIPAAPLWALVIANMLFAMMGIVLALFAIMASDDGNKDVQVRLSITGLVADRFEGAYARRDVKKVEDLFEEKNGEDSVRIGIVKAEEGGYTYSVSRRV